MGNKKWFDVTVTETYHDTYKVLAEDADQAYTMANEMVNSDYVNPSNNGESYDRTTEVSPGDCPEENSEFWAETKCDIVNFIYDSSKPNNRR